MLKSTKQTAAAVLKGVSMAALLSGVLATNATAEDAKIKSASFSIQPAYQHDEIIVTSSDGKKWDTIDAKALKLSATMHLDTKHPGYVKQVGILLGNCNNTECANNPVMFYQALGQRDYHANKLLTFPGSKIPLSTNGIAVPGYGDEILNSCNGKLQANGATKSYSFNKSMTASFSANTRKGHGINIPQPEVSGLPEGVYPDYNGGDVTRQAQFAVKVICKPYVVPPMVLKNTLFMAYTHGSKGCPRKATVEAQFYTDRAGKIEFMLFRDDGAKQKISVTTTKKEGGIYHVYWSKKYNFTKSVDRKYMIVVLGHNYSSSWKPLVGKGGAQNDAAGKDELTGNPKPNNEIPKLKVTGELTLADKAGAPKDKPRLGQAVFKIWATKPGSTSYKLTCGGGSQWEGTLPTIKVGNKKYQAVGAQNFQISKTEQIGCALRSKSMAGDPVIALATKLFRLTQKPKGPGQKTDVPNPTHGKPNNRPAVIVTPKPPKKPGIKVAPLPKTVCIGGKIANNSCFCPARTKKVKFGANKYRCQKSFVKPNLQPKRVAPKKIAPKAQINRSTSTKVRRLIGKKRRTSVLSR